MAVVGVVVSDRYRAMPNPRVNVSWTAKTPKKILSMRESRMADPLRPSPISSGGFKGVPRPDPSLALQLVSSYYM
jgi:hypothetical protein